MRRDSPRREEVACSYKTLLLVLSTGCPYKTWMLFLLVQDSASAPAGNTQGPRSKSCVIKKKATNNNKREKNAEQKLGLLRHALPYREAGRVRRVIAAQPPPRRAIGELQSDLRGPRLPRCWLVLRLRRPRGGREVIRAELPKHSLQHVRGYVRVSLPARRVHRLNLGPVKGRWRDAGRKSLGAGHRCEYGRQRDRPRPRGCETNNPRLLRKRTLR